ncbi:prion-inhibition and propagation-domain-containing protein [Pyrenochaeta sp. MPI-SDFR-AT-0127]|nr:prion-inhibition and propagation-domain-containing protein [Pyrenochaeta sp. MPI-SDFR-AT-0127]
MAELAIGGVSFFFQVFSGCIQGYELIADACRLRDDCQALLVKFKIEEHRLLNWAKLVQLDYRDDKLVLNHLSKGLIINIMEQQQKLLFSFGRLNKKYERLTDPLLVEEVEAFVLQNSDLLLENGDSTNNGTNGSTEEGEKTLKFPPTEDLVKMSLKFMQNFRDVPRRLKWATFDHKKMEALIVKLADFNDKMHDALDKAQMDLLIDMQTRTNDQIVLLNRTMTSMVQIYRSEQLAFRRQYTIADLEDSEYDDLYGSSRPVTRDAAPQPLAALAQQNFIHLAIEDSQIHTEATASEIGLPHLAKDIRQTELLFEDVQTENGESFPDFIEEGERTEARYNNTSVWIEWKNPDPSGPPLHDGGIDPKIHARVKKLAALLSKNNRTVRFRAPFCRGYFIDEDEGRFGLVFEKPAAVPAETVPQSLHSLIQASNEVNSKIEMPSLTDRITLMRLVSETVERLHAVDWLHKGLRSANILLFPKKDGEINYADPYISGFDYSRPATSDDMTERPLENPSADIYRHPTVQHEGNREKQAGRESYKKSFDLYSLGVVLLEIAYWKTIDQILSIDLEKAKPRHTWAVRERLLETEPHHLKFVKSYLGNTVEDVIRSCLVGPEKFGLDKDCDEKREVIAAGLQKALGEKVVKRLSSMKGL